MKYSLSLLSAFVAGSLFAGRPVARWDVIPYQRVSSVFKAGVVAFHEKDVRVAFSVNGKTVHTAFRPEFNDRTKVWEFVFPFDAAKYPDGLVRLGAKAIVDGEDPFVLPELELYANAGKTQGARKAVWVDPTNGNEFADGTAASPVKTIRQGVQRCGDGGTVYLMPGTYQAKLIGGGKDRKYWTRILPAKGVTRAQVKIVGGRTGTERLHFINCELFCDVSDGYGTVIMGEGGRTMAWFDNCRIYNKQGRYAGTTSPFGNRLRAFVTGGITEEITNGPNGELVRNHVVRSIADNAFAGNDCLVVNTTVSDIDATGTSADPDLFNGFATGSNWVGGVIFYNVRATDCKAKALAGQRLRDSAFVNLAIGATSGEAVCSRFSEEMENVLFMHVTLVDQSWQWMQTKNGRGDFKPTDVRMFNNVFRRMDGYETGDGSQGLLVRGTAYYNADATGKAVVFGEKAVGIARRFPGEADGNFALPGDSVAATAGIPLPCVPADINGVPYPNGDRPCGAYAK
ncbi:MAG: hypothetical protein ACI4R9_07905 [Kiritimatiellia bacterium]